MAGAPDRLRWTVLFSGRVQGVGFRYTTAQVARDHPVEGAVRNLPDGRVELLAEGDPTHLQAFIEAIRRQMGGCIRDIHVDEGPATGEFDGFEIRH